MKMISIAFCSCLITILCGCGKGYLDVNTNPNAPTTGAAVLVFTNAETQTAATINSDFFNMNYYMDYTALEYLLLDIARNSITSSDFQGFWNDAYHNLEDYRTVELSSASGQPFLVAAAKTMEVLNFQMLVDGYNDIPYSQALQLASGITNPAYDPGQSVYTGCITNLDSAITLFESDSVTASGSYNPGAADVLFQGNVTSWIRLANTLKLRMLLHEINVTGQASFIQAEAAKIAADPNGCLGAGQTAFVNPGYATDASGHQNPLWSTMGYNINGGVSNNEQRATDYMITKLKGYNDPRIAFFYVCDAQGQVQGNPVGDPNNANATYVGSGPGPSSTPNPPPFGISGPTLYGILQSPTQPAILLSSWESLFLQAEATERGLLPGGDAAAMSYYQQAITDNFKYLNVYTDGTIHSGDPATFATSYYSQNIPNVGWSASTDKIQAIITQKYISLCYTNSEEAWTDFRRTGFPTDLAVSNDPTILYPHILRFIYPQSEYDANAGNVSKEGTVTPVSPKIFWMP